MVTEILQAHVGNLGTQMLVRTRRQKLCSVKRNSAPIHIMSQPVKSVAALRSTRGWLRHKPSSWMPPRISSRLLIVRASPVSLVNISFQLTAELCWVRTQPGSENNAQTDLARTRQSPPWRIWFPSRAAASGVPGSDVASLQQAREPWLWAFTAEDGTKKKTGLFPIPPTYCRHFTNILEPACSTPSDSDAWLCLGVPSRFLAHQGSISGSDVDRHSCLGAELGSCTNLVKVAAEARSGQAHLPDPVSYNPQQIYTMSNV